MLPGRPDVLRAGPSSPGPRRIAPLDRTALRPHAPRREAADGPLPDALARLQPLHRRHPLRRRDGSRNHRRADRLPPLRARKPRHRPRPGRLHGNEKARGLLLMAATRNAPAFSVDDFLAAEERKDLLRFTTAGSVDDGKSTLIGRLLYD